MYEEKQYSNIQGYRGEPVKKEKMDNTECAGIPRSGDNGTRKRNKKKYKF